MTLLNHAEWEQFTAAHPGAHLLQTGAWGALKSGFGWSALRLQAGDCGAQVLFRRLPLGLTVAYLPKGPLGSTEGWPALWLELDEVCRQQHAVFCWWSRMPASRQTRCWHSAWPILAPLPTPSSPGEPC